MSVDAWTISADNILMKSKFILFRDDLITHIFGVQSIYAYSFPFSMCQII